MECFGGVVRMANWVEVGDYFPQDTLEGLYQPAGLLHTLRGLYPLLWKNLYTVALCEFRICFILHFQIVSSKSLGMLNYMFNVGEFRFISVFLCLCLMCLCPWATGEGSLFITPSVKACSSDLLWGELWRQKVPTDKMSSQTHLYTSWSFNQ